MYVECFLVYFETAVVLVPVNTTGDWLAGFIFLGTVEINRTERFFATLEIETPRIITNIELLVRRMEFKRKEYRSRNQRKSIILPSL